MAYRWLTFFISNKFIVHPIFQANWLLAWVWNNLDSLSTLNVVDIDAFAPILPALEWNALFNNRKSNWFGWRTSLVTYQNIIEIPWAFVQTKQIFRMSSTLYHHHHLHRFASPSSFLLPHIHANTLPLHSQNTLENFFNSTCTWQVGNACFIRFIQRKEQSKSKEEIKRGK